MNAITKNQKSDLLSLNTSSHHKDSYNNYKNEQAKCDIKYKKELCYNFIKRGNCKYNFRCRFAHGIDDLITEKDKNINLSENKKNSFDNQTFSLLDSKVITENKMNLKEPKYLNDLKAISNTLKLRKPYQRLSVFKSITTDSTNDNSFENSFTSLSMHSPSLSLEIEKTEKPKGKSKLSLLLDSKESMK